MAGLTNFPVTNNRPRIHTIRPIPATAAPFRIIRLVLQMPVLIVLMDKVLPPHTPLPQAATATRVGKHTFRVDAVIQDPTPT